MCLGLERDDGVYLTHLKLAGGFGTLGGELLDTGTFDKGHIVLVGRHQTVGVVLRGLFDELEQRHGHFLAVDDKSAIKYLVAAVLAVDLREAEHLTVGQRAPQTARQLLEVGNLLVAQCQAFLTVVALHVVDIDNGGGLAGDVEQVTVQLRVHALKHLVVCRHCTRGSRELLDTADAGHRHVLRDLDRIGAPRSHHLAARTHKRAMKRRLGQFLAIEQPLQFLGLLQVERMVAVYGIDCRAPLFEESYHNYIKIGGWFSGCKVTKNSPYSPCGYSRFNQTMITIGKNLSVLLSVSSVSFVRDSLWLWQSPEPYDPKSETQ